MFNGHFTPKKKDFIYIYIKCLLETNFTHIKQEIKENILNHHKIIVTTIIMIMFISFVVNLDIVRTFYF
jgi:hypothetical protein